MYCRKRAAHLTDVSHSSTTVALGDGVQISLSRQGSGAAVMLLHGIGGRKEHWNAVMAQLGEGAALIASDARNYGGSVGPAVTDFNDFADDVVSLLDALEISKVIGVGHSMGGRTLLEAAVRWPQRFAALLLSGAQPAYLEHMSEAEASEYVTKRQAMFSGDAVSPEMAERVARSVLPEDAAPEVIHTVTDGFVALRPEGYLSALAASVGWDRRADLGALKMPITMIGGELDTVCPPEATHTMARLIGQGDAVILPGVGHMAPLEVPERVAAHLRNLLERHGSDADQLDRPAMADL